MVGDVVGPNVLLRVRLATDRATGRQREFGHIDLVSAEAAEKAVRELDGIEVMGRAIRADFVSESLVELVTDMITMRDLIVFG
jgi:RNA recognition motif-containing protein